MSLWKCDLCGWEGRSTQQSGHKAWRCPKQGNLKRNLEKQPKVAKPWQILPCTCGCGTPIEQVRGKKKRHFVDREHYERWRAPTRTAQAIREEEARQAEKAQAAAAEKESRVRAEEMAPMATKGLVLQREAAAVPLVLGEASFLLWARCLGFAV